MYVCWNFPLFSEDPCLSLILYAVCKCPPCALGFEFSLVGKGYFSEFKETRHVKKPMYYGCPYYLWPLILYKMLILCFLVHSHKHVTKGHYYLRWPLGFYSSFCKKKKQICTFLWVILLAIILAKYLSNHHSLESCTHKKLKKAATSSQQFVTIENLDVFTCIHTSIHITALMAEKMVSLIAWSTVDGEFAP